MSLRHGEGQFRLRLLCSHFHIGSEMSQMPRSQLRLSGSFFGDFNATDTGGVSLQGRCWQFPDGAELKKLRCLMQLPEVRAGDGHDRMAIMQIKLGRSLVQIGVEQPRVGDKSATGWQMKRDPEAGTCKLSLEAT